MKYISTRGGGNPVLFSEGILRGMAPDGGLYIPLEIPRLPIEKLAELAQLPTENLAELAVQVLDPWLEEDGLRSSLSEICKNAFQFQTPLEWIGESTALLELYHGPTAAFKDVGARFLSECLSRLPEAQGRTLLVATSGDTGGAVASAFFGKETIRVIILYPRGKVSERQEHQLTAWGGNIQSFSVNGDFDDCQRMVKALLQNTQESGPFLSANSINLGRLLPQTLYYGQAGLTYLNKMKKLPGFIVPSGNLGNAFAALWARRMGFPIREVVFATNANRPVVDYLEKGIWKPRKTLSTLANAMDVGNPSNMERLFDLYPDISQLRKVTRAFSVTDQEISQTIQNGEKKWGKIFCPHTATAVCVREKIQAHPLDSGQDWVIVATAHPAKFDSIVEPLIGRKVDLPDALKEILLRPKRITEIEADVDMLKHRLVSSQLNT